jgi:hypothetical protein
MSKREARSANDVEVRSTAHAFGQSDPHQSLRVFLSLRERIKVRAQVLSA